MADSDGLDDGVLIDDSPAVAPRLGNNPRGWRQSQEFSEASDGSSDDSFVQAGRKGRRVIDDSDSDDQDEADIRRFPAPDQEEEQQEESFLTDDDEGSSARPAGGVLTFKAMNEVDTEEAEDDDDDEEDDEEDEADSNDDDEDEDDNDEDEADSSDDDDPSVVLASASPSPMKRPPARKPHQPSNLLPKALSVMKDQDRFKVPAKTKAAESGSQVEDELDKEDLSPPSQQQQQPARFKSPAEETVSGGAKPKFKFKPVASSSTGHSERFKSPASVETAASSQRFKSPATAETAASSLRFKSPATAETTASSQRFKSPATAETAASSQRFKSPATSKTGSSDDDVVEILDSPMEAKSLSQNLQDKAKISVRTDLMNPGRAVSPKESSRPSVVNTGSLFNGNSVASAAPTKPFQSSSAMTAGPSETVDVVELQKELISHERKIDVNEKLLSKQIKQLPDGGKKLQQYIDGLKEKRDLVKAKLNSIGGPQGQKAAAAALTDEQRLERSRAKLRACNRDFALTHNATEKLKLLKVREKLTKEIVELDANIKVKEMSEAGKSGAPKMVPPPAVQSNAKWQEFRAGIGGENGVGGVDGASGASQDPRLLAQGPVANPLYGGRMNDARRNEVISSIGRRIELIKKSNESRPNEADEEEDPKGLRSSIKLFPHQKQGLAWMLWRENQHPGGGILADDMGLGKTLTLIALILKSKELFERDDSKENDEGSGSGSGGNSWIGRNDKGSKVVPSKGTLVVCPASLIGHWETEAKSRLKPGTLNVLVYHGTNRQQTAKTLARYDLVITTYGTLSSEVKKVMSKEELSGKGGLNDLKAIDLDNVDSKNVHFLSVGWKRVILDEAHQVRNPRSQASQSVCRLMAAKRWAVTGTPIQNKELDLYSLIRFLRVDPFDEYKVWKLWVDNKTSMGQSRMNALVENLLLRRTKSQTSSVTGKAIVELPAKSTVSHPIQLTDEERKIYDRVFSFSQQAMINYMKKHDEDYEEPIIANNDVNKNNKDNQFAYKPPVGSSDVTARVNFGQDGDVKAHHLLVLLLRLRQICCHPGLIKTMIDTESEINEGLNDENGDDDKDLIAQMSSMAIGGGAAKGDGKGGEGEGDADADEELRKNVLSPSNPMFNEQTVSSKIRTLVGELRKLKTREKGGETSGEKGGEMEKVVVVSQWTSMLNIVKKHLKELGMQFAEIHGQVPVKLRGDIVNGFNRRGSGPQVMLLSLGAGGVGLNLVGANHLFLLDMHWNPQLESQACDRIYRVGQIKETVIHRFLCEGTVESRILDLQKKKLALADGILTGAKRSNANKLTIQDLKTLFEVA